MLTMNSERAKRIAGCQSDSMVIWSTSSPPQVGWCFTASVARVLPGMEVRSSISEIIFSFVMGASHWVNPSSHCGSCLRATSARAWSTPVARVFSSWSGPSGSRRGASSPRCSRPRSERFCPYSCKRARTLPSPAIAPPPSERSPIRSQASSRKRESDHAPSSLPGSRKAPARTSARVDLERGAARER